MGKIDLSRNITFQDFKNIDIKSKFSKKKAVLPSKHGINLMPTKQKKKASPLVIIGALVMVAAVIAGCMFGIYKPISALRAAKSEYNEVHAAYTEAAQAVGDYDAVLAEYRSYSLDWMNGDKAYKYVSVPRETILEMVDKKIYPSGTLSSMSIASDVLTVRMADMTLTEITQMLSDVESEPFVSYAFLQQATSQQTQIVTVDENGEEVITEGPETVIFTVVINLQKVQEAEQ